MGNEPEPTRGEERCDGMDNDGDDAVDEDWPELGEACGEGGGRGECVLGEYVCAPGGMGVVCEGAQGPTDEVCDGKDNDCDGIEDNGPEEICDAEDNDCDGLVDAADPDCQACVPTEDPEVSCTDDLDNDCDGLFDGDDPDCQTACDNDGVCGPGGDCGNCANDCDGVTNGPPRNRFCCGNGVIESAEGDGTICDGNF